MKVATVKEIHNDFDSAAERIISNAKALREDRSKVFEAAERGKKLSALGFGNFNNIVTDGEAELSKGVKELELINKYKLIASAYKFITEGELTKLLSKYNLIAGEPRRYIGEIPEKNQNEILNFNYKAKLKPEDITITIEEDWQYFTMMNDRRGYMRMRSTDEDIPVAYSRRFIYTARVDNRELITSTFELSVNNYSSDVSAVLSPTIERIKMALAEEEQRSKFQIVAAPYMFNLTGASIGSDNRIKNNPAPIAPRIAAWDPIVLAEVQGGYLIVSKWGEEAELNEFKNSSEN